MLNQSLPRFSLKCWYAMVAALLVLSAGQTASAADTYWNVASGDWFTGANWDTTNVPTVADNVYIDNGGTSTIGTAGAVADFIIIGDTATGDGHLVINNGGTLSAGGSNIAQVLGSTGSLTVTGAGSTYTDSFAVVIGQSGVGTLVVSDGGVIDNAGQGGFAGFSSSDGSNGLVTGSGSKWMNGAEFIVGNSSQAELTISAGGEVSNTWGLVGRYGSGANGSIVTVTGTDSKWTNSGLLTVGYTSVADVDIEAGGQLFSAGGLLGDYQFGFDSGEGTVNVTGAGSKWTNTGTLTVGDEGYGELNISDGAEVSNTSAVIGNYTGFPPNDTYFAGQGRVGVTGTNSRWINSGTLTVGNSGGFASLIVSDGGAVSNTSGTIGAQAGLFGFQSFVIVTGTGASWTNSSDLTVGDSGNGFLAIRDGGVVNATGNLTLANNAGSIGGLQIGFNNAPGILNTSSVNGGDGTATLDFNHTGADYFFTNTGLSGGTAVTITGSTIVNHTGSGQTTLNGTNTYVGATTIDAGTLVINGSISNSTTTVNASGTLMGTGTTGDVNVSGIIAPGNSIGTINVGSIDYTGGGLYEVEVDSAGNSDLINASGSATLAGGSVEVQPEAGTYNFITNYTILTAAGGVSDTYDGVTSTDAGLVPTLIYDANNVYLRLVNAGAIDLASVARTPNQTAVSNMLNTLISLDPVSIESIISAMIGLSDTDTRMALDNLSGIQHSVNPMLYNRQALHLLDLIHRMRGHGHHGQTRSAFNPYQGPLLASNNHGLQAGSVMAAASVAAARPTYSPGPQWWIQGYASDGDIDPDVGGTLPGMDYQEKSLVVGVDMPVRENWRIGLAGSYTQTDIEGRGSDADADGYQIAAYANWSEDDWYANLAAGYAWHDTETDRTVTVGLTSALASSDYDSHTLGLSIEAGKHFAMGDGVTLTPYAGFEYARTDRDSFREMGTFGTLAVDDETNESIRGQLGVAIAKTYTQASGSTITPRAKVAYVHESGDTDNLMRAGLSATPATTFTVEGHDMDRDRLQLGLGLSMSMDDDMQFHIGYDGEFAGSDDYHSLNVSLSMRWD